MTTVSISVYWYQIALQNHIGTHEIPTCDLLRESEQDALAQHAALATEAPAMRTSVVYVPI